MAERMPEECLGVLHPSTGGYTASDYRDIFARAAKYALEERDWDASPPLRYPRSAPPNDNVDGMEKQFFEFTSPRMKDPGDPLNPCLKSLVGYRRSGLWRKHVKRGTRKKCLKRARKTVQAWMHVCAKDRKDTQGMVYFAAGVRSTFLGGARRG